MKKILAIILALSCAFVMFACGENAVCETCVDEDKNCVCDACGKTINCNDADKNGKCDVCGKDVAPVVEDCTEHKDENLDNFCDICGANLYTGGCTTHADVNKDGKCDTCGKVIACTVHIDVEKDGKCDVCGVAVTCTVCVDKNKDAKCDVCGADVACNVHIDVNKDGVCDVCSAEVEIVCFNHVDADGDYKCDICSANMNAQAGATGNYAEDAKDFIDALSNTVVEEVRVIASVEGLKSSGFLTEYGADGAYTIMYTYPVYNDDVFADEYTYVSGSATYDKDGNFVSGDANVANDVAASTVKANLASEKIQGYQVSATTLAIAVRAQDSVEVLGLQLANDALVVVTLDAQKAVSSITLEYIDAQGNDVTVVTTYNPD